MFQGIGIGYCVLNGLVCIYYNVIIAISLFYLFASFTADVPWGSCGHEWNTDACGDEPGSHFNINASMNGTLNYTYASAYNLTSNMTGLNVTKTSPSEEYFRRYLLNMTDEHGITNLGEIRWHLCLCLLLAWILVVMFVSRGIQSTGKVAYFTATFPYVMLTVLVVRGVTLPGAANGILYFVTPNWELLAKPDVWFAAASQLFYSTNLAWGGMITMASYNNFNHNCYRDAIMINMVSFFTSIYACFAVFSIIGYMADSYGLEVHEVIKSGPGLAFIAYPRALSLMPLAPMWSALFFFMLFLLGVGSQMVQVETLMTGLTDLNHKLATRPSRRFAAVVVVCFCGFLIGIPCTTQGGMYVLQLMDHYSASFSVLIIACTECFVINWIYGTPTFAANMKQMLDHYPGVWWRICWKFISPLVIFAILAFSFVKYEPAKYGEERYPYWCDALGWVMVLTAVVPIFVIALVKYIKADGVGFREKWKNATTPNLDPPASIEVGQERKIDLNPEANEIVTNNVAEEKFQDVDTVQTQPFLNTNEHLNSNETTKF
eukprot:GHVT01006633.1.p1 GENE.GHVT01006633.1~~GHVT01006633.1.p1  ORF type:complete len:554 (+),score=1.71 GHVT01006633.1:27-1664(+)